MDWFGHRHRWGYLASAYQRDEGGLTIGEMQVQQCGCGAIRQIECLPGKDPIIRTAMEWRDA